MKKAILAALIMITTSGCFSPSLVTFQDDGFVEVYENLDAEQDELYLKANEWMVGIFKDAESVVQHSDKDEGVIIGKYLMVSSNEDSGLYNKTVKGDVVAIIDIRVKDDRCRLSIQPQDYYYWDGFGVSYSKQKAADEIMMLADSFQDKIKTEKIDF